MQSATLIPPWIWVTRWRIKIHYTVPSLYRKCYSQPTKLREDNVFSRVCLSVILTHGGGPHSTGPWPRQIPSLSPLDMFNLTQRGPRCIWTTSGRLESYWNAFFLTPSSWLFYVSGDDACASNPCRNRATCVDTAATEEGYVCRCSDGYHGNQCQNKVPPETSCDALQSSMTANPAEDTSTETVTSTTGIGQAISTSSFTVSGLTTSDLELEQQTSRPGVTQTETQMVSPRDNDD